MKILFVCTGNTCRSPMAQVMAAQLFGKHHEVASAGIMAMPKQKASKHAIEAMKQRQIDLTKHKSQMLSEKLLNWADLVLTMTESHKSAISDDKVHTLGEYAATKVSISDPFGGDLDTYLSCAKEIYDLLIKIEHKLKGEKK